MAHAAERGWVWFRRRQGAVSVVVCQRRHLEVGQFLLVRLINPFLKLVSVVSDSKSMEGWGQRSVLSDKRGVRVYYAEAYGG